MIEAPQPKKKPGPGWRVKTLIITGLGVILAGFAMIPHGSIGGAPATKAHPYHWDGKSQLVVVFDDALNHPEGCTFSRPHYVAGGFGAPSLSFGIESVSIPPRSGDPVTMTCDHARVMTGTKGFFINSYVMILIVGVGVLVIAGVIKRRRNPRSRPASELPLLPGT